MMRIRHLLSIVFFGFFIQAGAQVNRYGLPFQRNYSMGKLNFAEQNWAVAQDSKGIMYFGNNDNGVLEYDGVNWRSIPLPNNINVRSLAIDSLDRIFVGAVNEFGVVLPDQQGNLKYHSLSNQLDSTEKLQDQVLKTYVFNGKVYFCSSNKVFIYDYNKVKSVSTSGAFLTFIINNQFYVGTSTLGLTKFLGDSLIPLKGGEEFKGKAITALIPGMENELIVVTAFDGVYRLNIINGDCRKSNFKAEVSGLLKGNVLYDGIPLPSENYAIATLGTGMLVLDQKGEAVDLLSKSSTGLMDDQVTSIFYNQKWGIQSPVWLSLNSGLARAELNSPYRYFSEESGLNGSVTDIVRFNGILYVATSAGVFYLDYPYGTPPVFRPIVDKINTYWTWSFCKFKIPGTNSEKLLIGTFQGLFELVGKNNVRSIDDQVIFPAKKSNDAGINATKILQSTIDPGRLIVGSFGLEIFHYKAGSWTKNKITKLEEEIRSVQEDDKGNIWLGSYLNGVIQVIFEKKDTLVKRFGITEGLPSLRDIHVYKFKKRLYFATTHGLYRYDSVSNHFYPDSSFGGRYSDGSRGIFQILNPSTDVYWLLCYKNGAANSWIEKATFKNNVWTYETRPYKRQPAGWSDVIYLEDNGILWTGQSNFLFSYNQSTKYTCEKTFNALIRSVTIGQDSVIFYGNFMTGDSLQAHRLSTQPSDMIPEIPYRMNNVTFSYAGPFFEDEDAVEFAFRLDGLNSSWSKWSSENKFPYTNLGEGTYTFRLKARNIYGVESSEATYTFRILPPWYRTIFAWVTYVILLGLFIWVIVKYNTRRLQLEKIRLEALVQERTAEVVKQKEEIEAQRDEIIAQKKDITDSIRYASRIQQAVLPSEKMLNEQLPDHFILFKPRDIVSGDFYWMTQRDNKIFLVVADCTGHGVPGAFMSMLGMSFLNEIVNKSSIEQANLILNELREHVITQLKQTGTEGETKDGMDLSLMIIDKKNKKLQFSGANNPLYMVRKLTPEEIANPVSEDELPRGNLRNDKYELMQINADKMPIGISAHLGKSFTNTEIDLQDGIALYISSDGYEDQFGGPNGKKFLSKSLKRLILKLQGKPMSQQKEMLDKTIEDWRGDLDQVDDILMMGVMLQ